jgi:hypothetical protein
MSPDYPTDRTHKTMTYEVIELEYSDVLASYASLEEAHRGLAGYLEESPERESELGLATVDDDGNAVSVQPAAELHVTR